MNLPPFDLQRTPIEPGTVLLEASAGTGKTYTLVGILLRLLLEGHIERLDQALVVTFTVAATDELKNRLRAALQRTLHAVTAPERERDAFFRALAQRPGAAKILQRAIAGFDQVGIATMHGFCKRLLEEAAFESHEPFALEFTADPLPLWYRAAADALRLQYEPGVTPRSALLQCLDLSPSKLTELYRAWRRHPDVRLDPTAPELEARLQDLTAALAAAAAACDDAALARIADLVWKSDKSPFAGSERGELQRFAERLRNTPPLVLGALCSLAPAAEAMFKKSAAKVAGEPFFRACDAVRAATEAALPDLRSTLLFAMHARVEQAKRQDHVLTFDDLLVRAHTALRDPQRRPALLGVLRERHTVGLIDEFQDTDSLQYEIFADCFAGRSLFLIGDPKQAIYGFRGADLRTYLTARGDAVRQYTLAVNHRSAAPLVHAVRTLFARHAHPFVDARITMPPVTAAAKPGELAIAGDGDGDTVLRWRFLSPTTAPSGDALEQRIAADVAAEASRLLRAGLRLDGRPLRARDLAVLTRTNLQAITVQNALRAVGIPSAIGKAGDIFETDELTDLTRFLYAVLHPTDLARVRAAMCTRLWGLDADGVLALERDEPAFDRALDALARWRRLWLRFGFIVMQEQALADLDAHERLLACHGGERRLTNFRQLFELLHDAEHSHRLSPEGLCEWLAHERASQDDLDYTLRELRLESDEDAAQILTAHGSKGLQYEIVFCPFLWSSRDPRGAEVAPTADGHQLVVNCRKDDPHYGAVLRARLEEDLRLAYVALTRAKRRCYVHWGPLAKNSHGAALAWLLLGTTTEPGRTDGRDDEDWLEHWRSRAKTAAPRWAEALAELVAASDGTMHAIDLEQAAAGERLPDAPARLLPPPRRKGREPRALALHSFSSLVAASHDPEPPADLEPRRAPERTATTTAGRGIFAFARGPRAGQCLHTVLERIDLATAASENTQRVVRDVLHAEGLLDAAAHAGELDPVADVHTMLQHLAAAVPAAGDPPLAELCSGPRAVEWQFALPTDAATVQQLADLFAASASAPARAQAERLRRLQAPALRGFLVGFVDLVAEHAGRHWVLDWKSNWLGNDAADYDAARLLPVMVEHDYVLQYHLYVLALHRHLRARRRDYDYERHVGGVVYAFLRGVLPGSACGLFRDRVPAALVHAMDHWLAGRAAEVAP